MTRPRRCLLAVIAAMAGVGINAAGPAGAQEGSTVRAVRVASISPFLDRTHPFRLALQVGNPGEVAVEGLTVRVAVFGRVSSRSQLRIALDRRPTTALIGGVTQSIDGTIAPGALRTVTIERDVGALSPAMTRSGVYPIEIAVRHSRGESTLRTAVPYFAGAPRAPINVAWILPVDRPTAIRSDGSYASDAVESLGLDELTQQMDVLVKHAPAPVTLAVTARLADMLNDLSDGFVRRADDVATAEPTTSSTAQQAARALDAMRRAAATVGAIATTPFAPADLPSLAAHGLRSDIVRQITAGRSGLGDLLRRRPDFGFAVPPGLTVDRRAAASLAGMGITSVVLAPETLPRQPTEPYQPDLFGPSRPVRVSSASIGFTALLPDRDLRARLDGPEQGVLLGQAIIAETASAWLELPALAPERVITITSSRAPSPTALDAALAGLRAAPWVRLVTAASAIEELEPRGDELPLPQMQRPDSAALAAAREARIALRIFEQISVERSQQLDADARFILLAESAEWTGAPATGAALAGAVTERVRRVLGGIGIVRRPVTLTSRRGDVPITLLNRNPFPVRVQVALRSAKVAFPSGAARTVELVERDTTIDFDVEALATGSFPLDIVVTTPNGDSRISADRVVLRSTAVSAVALAAVGGSALFLLGASVRRSVRRRRGARRADEARSARTTG